MTLHKNVLEDWMDGLMMRHVCPFLYIHLYRFIPGLQRANIVMDRKVLSELAVTEPFSFKAVVDTVKSAQTS